MAELEEDSDKPELAKCALKTSVADKNEKLKVVVADFQNALTKAKESLEEKTLTITTLERRLKIMLVEKAAIEEELRLATKELASFMEKSILSEEDLEAVKKEREEFAPLNVESDNLADQVSKVHMDSFNNAIAQIQHFNPGVV